MGVGVEAALEDGPFTLSVPLVEQREGRGRDRQRHGAQPVRKVRVVDALVHLRHALRQRLGHPGGIGRGTANRGVLESTTRKSRLSMPMAWNFGSNIVA